jgi:hypothetical protein
MLSIVQESDQFTKHEQPTFDDFWLLYPKRMARLEAVKAWSRMTSVQHVAAITGLVGWRKVWMDRGELQFVPNAATWLRGERWEDELPMPQGMQAGDLSPLHLSHVAANLPDRGERVSMPEHVRALLAKLRGK